MGSRGPRTGVGAWSRACKEWQRAVHTDGIRELRTPEAARTYVRGQQSGVARGQLQEPCMRVVHATGHAGSSK